MSCTICVSSLERLNLDLSLFLRLQSSCNICMWPHLLVCSYANENIRIGLFLAGILVWGAGCRDVDVISHIIIGHSCQKLWGFWIPGSQSSELTLKTSKEGCGSRLSLLWHSLTMATGKLFFSSCSAIHTYTGQVSCPYTHYFDLWSWRKLSWSQVLDQKLCLHLESWENISETQRGSMSMP